MLVTRTVTSTEEAASSDITTSATVTTNSPTDWPEIPRAGSGQSSDWFQSEFTTTASPEEAPETTTTTTWWYTTTEQPDVSSDDYDETTTTITTSVPLAQLIYSGQYHEVNPGQYHEVNPGQYHEINPGQYNEVNPGQYSTDRRGDSPKPPSEQYFTEEPRAINTAGSHNTLPSKSLNDVQVEVQHTDDAQIYNVQSEIDGRFIIGEYGTISKESGQTLQGVRYTAVSDVSVDPSLIYQTLIKYFPMQADPGDYNNET